MSFSTPLNARVQLLSVSALFASIMSSDKVINPKKITNTRQRQTLSHHRCISATWTIRILVVDPHCVYTIIPLEIIAHMPTVHNVWSIYFG